MDDIVDVIERQAMVANACFEAGLHAAEAAMGDRLIAAGARAAESERRLRHLIAACENAMASGYSRGEMMRRLTAALEEAREP